MRNHEQFKSFVYAKAEAALIKRKKQWRVLQSGICAGCVCICLAGILFSKPYGLFENTKDACTYAEAVADATGTLTFCNGQPQDVTYDRVTAETATAFVADKTDNDDISLIGELADGTMLNSTGNTIRYFTVVKNNAEVDGSELVQIGVKDAPSASYEMYVDYANQYGAITREERSTDNTVQVTIAAYYLIPPDVSNITVNYEDGTVSITVFADQVPVPYGSYIYCFSKILDSKKYFGQPIHVYFKTTAERDVSKELQPKK